MNKNVSLQIKFNLVKVYLNQGQVNENILKMFLLWIIMIIPCSVIKYKEKVAKKVEFQA